MAIARSIAYKVWISDVTSGNYTKQEGFNPNYIELDGKQVSRVNLIATVVGKFLSDDGNYGALTFDDGTETIRAKTFGPDVAKIKDAEVGQIIRIVGKIKEYNDERYLSPDFVSEIKDPNWLIVQKLELGEPKVREAPTPEHEQSMQAEAITEMPATEKEPEPVGEQAISESKTVEDMPNFIEIISKLDTGDGAEISAVIAECKLPEEEVKTFIVDLLKDGEIYEPRKGKLKVL